MGTGQDVLYIIWWSVRTELELEHRKTLAPTKTKALKTIKKLREMYKAFYLKIRLEKLEVVSEKEYKPKRKYERRSS